MWHALEATAFASSALSWLVQSTALLGAGLLAGRLLRRSGPTEQSVVYRTALVAALFCPAVSVLLSRAGVADFAIHWPRSLVQHSRLETAPEPSLPVPVPPRLPAPRPNAPDVSPAKPQAAVELPQASAFVRPAPRPSRTNYAELAPRVGLGIWLLGALALAARLLLAHLRLEKVRATAARAEDKAQALCALLAAEAGLRAPEVLRTPFLSSPCLVGLARPAILLPEDDGDDLRVMFLHELAHLARRDAHWALVRQLTCAVLWVQPLVWWLAKRLEATAEEACDDAVVQSGIDRTAYAKQLLDLAERVLRPALPAGIGIVALRSLLARRVVRILDPERSPARKTSARSLAFAFMLGAIATLLAAMLDVTGTRTAAHESPALANNAAEPQRGFVPDLPPTDTRPELERSIRAAVKYLEAEQLADGSWKSPSEDTRCGLTALATLALLSAGEPPDEPHVAAALEYLRQFRAGKLNNTYNISLQTMALATAGLERDRAHIADNAGWLARAQVLRSESEVNGGSWSYTAQNGARGDNSNSDFALLGLEAAAQVGVDVEPRVWAPARQYWRSAQARDGGWAYIASAGQATLSMTSAGLTALAIIGPRDVLFLKEPLLAAADQGAARLFYADPEVKAHVKSLSRAKAQYEAAKRLTRNVEDPALVVARAKIEALTEQINTRWPDLLPQAMQMMMSLESNGLHACGKDARDPALERGFAWLEREFSVTGNRRTSVTWKYYSLAGLERASTLNGKRFIGPHDWYREGFEELRNTQDRLTGSWAGTAVEQDPTIATSFALLFLARGRAPLLIGKLQHGPDDDWNNDPHDVRNLTAAVSEAWRKPLRWELIEENHASADDLMRTPLIFLNGHEPPVLRPETKLALRDYIERGGTIVAEACCSRPEFDRGFRALVKEMFPNAPGSLRLLPDDHAVWSARHVLRPDDHPLRGLEFGGRTAILYSATDLSCGWNQAAAEPENRASGAALRLGENIVTYALTQRARAER